MKPRRKGFAEMSVAEHLEEATRMMREISEDQAWTPELVRAIERACAEFEASREHP